MSYRSSNSRPRPSGGATVRRWSGGLVALLVAGVGPALSPQVHPDVHATSHSESSSRTVIVTGPDVGAAAEQVRLARGRVTARLAIADGVVAELPVDARLPLGYSVVPDQTVSFVSETPSDATRAAVVRETVGLAATGDEGAGVTVALVDTGVADVEDLSGRLDHIDVTGTGQGDGYGHGTYLAGVIAGSGATSGGRYQGVAPRARILDVKVADSTGVTSLSLVLEGLQRVSDTAKRYRTRVVNLSLASYSPMPYQVDPLNQALRRLWHRGLVVVVASGNDGPAAGTVASPGNDPTLMTVGGLSDGYSAMRADDTVAAFSGRGPTDQGIQKPDLVAPGAHVVGLRSPGSRVDTAYPQARVDDHHVRASGTSAAAAVTSAAVASILATTPNLRPDQVKSLVTSTAYRDGDLTVSSGAGAGGLDLRRALDLAESPKIRGTVDDVVPAPGGPERWAALADAFSRGDKDGALAAWGALNPAARSWAARSWASLDPAARSWAARSWAATSWGDDETSSQEWAARSWAARSWAGEDWAARSWAGEDWAARSWAGEDWAARSWAGDDWAARSWAGGSWSARSWVMAWH